MTRSFRVLCVIAALIVLPLAAYRFGRANEGGASAGGGVSVPVLASPESRVVRESLKLQATVVRSDAVLVTVASAQGPLVVTDSGPAVGATLTPGTKGPAVNGEAGIVLDLTVTPYRDLAVGMSGPDVRAINESLARNGFPQVSQDGDMLTAAGAGALRALYSEAGVQPTAAGLNSESSDAVRAAERSLASAERSLQEDRDGLARATSDAAAARSDAQRAVAQSVRDLGVADISSANEVSSMERELSAAEAVGDPAAIASASDALNLARVQRLSQMADGQAAVDSARLRLDTAESALAASQKASPDGSVLAAAQEDLATALAAEASQVVVERDRIIVAQVGSPPVVTRSAPPVGTLVQAGELLIAAGADLAVRVDLSDRTTPPEVGTKARITGPGIEFDAAIPDVSTLPDNGAAQSSDREAGRLFLEFRVPPEVVLAVDTPVVVDIPLHETDGPVLAVPVTALWRGSKGTVVKVSAMGNTRTVDVKVGLVADGWAQLIDPRVDTSDQLILRLSTQ